jgi:hypothetical protein
MPRISERQKLLDALAQAREELGVQIFVQILLDAVNAESPTCFHWQLQLI